MKIIKLLAIVSTATSSEVTSKDISNGIVNEMDRQLKKEKITPYSKYTSYPEYCSTPEEMSNRKIPDIKKTKYKNTKLIQVQAIIRHGSRTPYTSGLNCWENYRSPKSDTSKWDCNIESTLAPPSSPEIDAMQKHSESPEMLFIKKYNALTKPLHNELNGTCQLGQLLQQGYVQEVQNGNILKDAYFNASRKSMHLFDDVLENETHLEPTMYYRADDMERTMLSGQVLLSALFERDVYTNPIHIKVHLADKSMDILEPNSKICPKLNDLQLEAYRSKEFISKNTSEEAMHMRNLIYNELHGDDPMYNPNFEAIDNYIDCLMTTICTDRSLPDLVNDFEKDSKSSNFNRLIEFSTWKWLYIYQYNNASYSKLGMAPLWADMSNRMIVATNKTTHDLHEINEKMEEFTNNDINRLVLYSAHDVTIMNLLATLDIKIADTMSIAPYASLLIFEIHAILAKDKVTDHVVRLLYNGQVMTQYIPNCPDDDELCPIDILLHHVASFATKNPDCTSELPIMKQKSSPKKQTTIEIQKNMTAMSNSPLISIFVALFSCFVGGFITYKIMTTEPKSKPMYISTVDADAISSSNNGYGATHNNKNTLPIEKVFDSEHELI